MTTTQPPADLDSRFSSEDASPTPWAEVERQLERAETYWITTVRDDGRPHSTTLVGIWLDDAFWFCTGPTEQKAKNLERHHDVLVTTGCSGFAGLDIVVEGTAARITDEGRLQRVADRFGAEYAAPFNYVVRDGAFSMVDGDTTAHVFEVRPRKILAFEKGDTFAQTRFVPRDAEPR